MVSKLRAFEEMGPGGVHHPQDGFTALFCSLTEGLTGQESITGIAITGAFGEGQAAAEKHDMLIATEVMQVHEELEELLDFHVFDK